MRLKKILTLDDLMEFYSDHKKSVHFDYSKHGQPIVVQTEGILTYNNDEKDYAEGLTPVSLQACHTEKNLNSSSISYDAMSDMIKSFANRPIMGYIHDVDGKPEFYGHNMHIEDEEIVYDEISVGVIPESNNAHMEYDQENDRYNVMVDGYIFDDYTKAKEILEREGSCSCSEEIAIRQMSYNAKDKVLNIEDGYFSAVTILGKDDDGNEVKPGMAGSNITLSSFDISENSIFSQDVYNDKMNTLKARGGVEEMGLDNVVDEETVETDVDVEETVVETEAESLVRTFEVSHEDIRFALYNLLMPFEEEDNEWYFIEAVYDDHFVYSNWHGDVIYGQGYSVNDDNVQFDGDRYKMFRELLTEAEYDALQQMRSNYQSMSDELHQYRESELCAQRNAVIEDTSYAAFVDEPEFTDIKNNLNTYSVEDLRNACDIAFAKCVKRLGTYSAQQQTDETKNTMVFAGAFDHNSDFLTGLLNKSR